MAIIREGQRWTNGIETVRVLEVKRQGISGYAVKVQSQSRSEPAWLGEAGMAAHWKQAS